MDVIVLEKSPFISYGTCSIPYYISEEIKDYRDFIAITPEKAETERGLVVRTRHETIAIDPGGKEVLVRSPDKAGDTRIAWVMGHAITESNDRRGESPRAAVHR